MDINEPGSRWAKSVEEEVLIKIFIISLFQVDMPVFFYIDAEYAEDPKLEQVDEIMLSYTFFESKEGMEVPLPNYMQMEK